MAELGTRRPAAYSFVAPPPAYPSLQPDEPTAILNHAGLDDYLELDILGLLWDAVGSSGERMLLTGTYQRTLDEKLRFAIPKHLRDALPCPSGDGLYVTPGTDGSLTLYTVAAFQALGERLGRNPPTRSDVRAFSRLFYGQAQYVEIDRQGRIRLPQELALLAKLEKEIVLVGVQDHLELWSPESWQRYVAGNHDHFDEIAETALSGGAVP